MILMDFWIKLGMLPREEANDDSHRTHDEKYNLARSFKRLIDLYLICFAFWKIWYYTWRFASHSIGRTAILYEKIHRKYGIRGFLYDFVNNLKSSNCFLLLEKFYFWCLLRSFTRKLELGCFNYYSYIIWQIIKLIFLENETNSTSKSYILCFLFLLSRSLWNFMHRGCWHALYSSKRGWILIPEDEISYVRICIQ